MPPTTLPVAPFENYMLDDDRTEHPMVFFVRTRLAGVLDRPRFEAAVAQAQTRHALLSSIIVEEQGRRFWRRLEQPAQPVIWNDDGLQSATQPRGIDLRRQAGLRVWVEETRGTTTVVWEFHHSCCDGTGAMQFVEDSLLLYAAATAGVSPALADLADECDSERIHFGLGRLRRLLRVPLNLLGTLGVLQFFVSRPQTLAAPRSGESSGGLQPAPAGRPATTDYTLNAGQVRQLHAAAKRAGVTINDLLLTDLFKTIDRWQGEHMPGVKRPCVRLSMPINLRSKGALRQTAANVVSMVFLDRRPRWYRSPASLLKSVRRDTWFIKRLRLGLVFNAVIAIFQQTLGGMEWLLGKDRCLATAVLSNLGPQLNSLPVPYVAGRAVLGDVRLERVELLPPVRKHTRAALGVVTYGGELTLSMHYDAHCLSRATADEFFSRYVQTVLATAGTATVEESPKPATIRVPVRSGVEQPAGAAA